MFAPLSQLSIENDLSLSWAVTQIWATAEATLRYKLTIAPFLFPYAEYTLYTIKFDARGSHKCTNINNIYHLYMLLFFFA